MTPEIYIGPAGWSYPDWAGIVYPTRKPRTFDPLTYLASYFNLIEINNTFYRVPERRTCREWVRRVEENPEFLFTAKAHRDFTHRQAPATNHEIRKFKEAIEPVYDSGRLGAVLLQFPWSFRMTSAATGRIKNLVAGIEPFPVAVEVRHGSWEGPDAAAFFHDSAIPLCGIDQPLIGHSLSPDTYMSGNAGVYFRLHGRNSENWFNHNASRDDRYNYLYTEKELGVWRDKVREVSDGTRRVFVVLNNHFRGQAVANALQLDAMLSGGKSPAPSGIVATYPVTDKHLKPVISKPAAGRLDRGDQLILFENENEEQKSDNPGKDL